MKPEYDGQDWFYRQQPPGSKVAEKEDFFLSGKIITGKPYLIHSEKNPEIFWAKRTKPGFMEHNDFELFLERGRIYVFEEE